MITEADVREFNQILMYKRTGIYLDYMKKVEYNYLWKWGDGDAVSIERGDIYRVNDDERLSISREFYQLLEQFFKDKGVTIKYSGTKGKFWSV